MYSHQGQGRYGSGNDMMWNDDGNMEYEVEGRNVQQSVGGYLEENPDFGGGYSQDDRGFGSGNIMGSQGSIKRNMGGHSRFVGSQSAIGGQGHMRESQSSMMGGQSGMMRGQNDMRGSQGRTMGGQSGMMGGQGHMMGGQSDMSGGQGRMMGGQSGMMGGQGGMIGDHSGMVGNQMGFGGGQQSISGQNNNELVELLKKQSDVINKLSEKIGLDTGYGNKTYGRGYGNEDYYGNRGGEPCYGNEYNRGYEEDYGYFDGPRVGPRGGGPYRGPQSRMMRGGPMRGGSRRGDFGQPRGGFTPGPGGRGSMRGSPGKRRGDFQGEFGGKRQRMDNEAQSRRDRSGYTVKTAEQKARDSEENKKGTEAMKPKATATQYRKYLRKKVQQQREEDGTFPAYEENKVIGKKYIENVEGYYCQKCRRFFRDESEAKIEHCMTWAHYQRIKNTKFPKEEDKKKDGDGVDGKGGGDEAVEMAADVKTDAADAQVDEEELLKEDE